MISRREGQRLKKRVAELESIIARQRERYVREWPSSVCIGSITVTDTAMAWVRTARALKHGVVVVPQDGNTLALYAAEIQTGF